MIWVLILKAFIILTLILTIILNDFDDNDPEINSHVRLMTWHNRLKKEISKELMPVAWHPTIFWNWYVSQD